MHVAIKEPQILGNRNGLVLVGVRVTDQRCRGRTFEVVVLIPGKPQRFAVFRTEIDPHIVNIPEVVRVHRTRQQQDGELSHPQVNIQQLFRLFCGDRGLAE